MKKKIILMVLAVLFSFTFSFGQRQFYHMKPTRENILKVMDYHNIIFQNYVLAQAIQESGLKPKSHNNLFGLKHRRGLYRFPHWSLSVKMYKDKIQSRYRIGENYLSFLNRIGYATDSRYTYKIRSIARTF